MHPEGFHGGSEVKRLPATWETWVQSLGREDPLEKEMATHSNILAWKILWTEEPGAGYRPCGVAKSRIRLSDFTSLSVFPRKPFPHQKKSEQKSDWLVSMDLEYQREEDVFYNI